ncbi:MAG: hypothetical protein U9N30_10315 [Campylobacterota bacterium]|nr:hypothetical protein [Campylobacterota bacterium]
MNNEHIFPCDQCGAKLTFSVEEGELQCPYCAHINLIQRHYTQVVEKDYEQAIEKLHDLAQKDDGMHDVKCPNCAATFEQDNKVYASQCSFCGTAVVNEVALYRPITPQALLPFSVTQNEVKEIFKTWLKNHWFAPSKLKHHSAQESKIKGIFIPHWTYDTNTYSQYEGKRGDVYYENERYTTRVNGQIKIRTRSVEKTSWTRVSGDLNKSFDDVLVMASNSISYTLSHWDLSNLVDYDKSYLSGFESEVYSIELDDGLELAKQQMLLAIKQDIKRKIGGDKQQITSLSSDYFDITFKHVLLPVYSSSYIFEDKEYNFVVNARSGEIKGERPYSKVKIVFAVLLAALAVGAVYYLGWFEN